MKSSTNASKLSHFYYETLKMFNLFGPKSTIQMKMKNPRTVEGKGLYALACARLYNINGNGK